MNVNMIVAVMSVNIAQTHSKNSANIHFLVTRCVLVVTTTNAVTVQNTPGEGLPQIAATLKRCERRHLLESMGK